MPNQIRSGIEELDTALAGGFSSGGRALHVTRLAGSHARMPTHLGSPASFGPKAILDKVNDVSGLKIVSGQGSIAIGDPPNGPEAPRSGPPPRPPRSAT